MSKMGEELERRLDENKYELYEALLAFDEYTKTNYPANMRLRQIASERMDAVLAKIDISGENADTERSKA